MRRSGKLSVSHTIVFIIAVSVILFAEGMLPYWYGAKKAPADKFFAGQIAYIPDQNMYFSFISQARDGHLIFNNKLTAIPNKPVFVNLEFLAVGLVQRITGISENAVYQVWRLMGIVLLATGFLFLARLVLPSARRIVPATLVLLCGGGFGFVAAALNALHLLGTDATQAGIIDMRFGIMPFQQMLVNPHFSFPHGLILIAYGFFLQGERDGRLKDYLLSGLTFCAVGLVRPYDIMLPFVVLPLHLVVNEGFRNFDLGRWTRKMLPLIMLLPVLAYDVWLFKINDIFKYWSLQGLNANKMPSAGWHYLAFGVSGILAIWRLAQVRKNPLSNAQRFLLLCFVATFCLIHLGKYMPIIGWSPQVGVYLAVPLALLGFSADFSVLQRSVLRRLVATAALAVAVIAGNLSILLYYTKYFRVYNYMYYVERDEVETWLWMRKNLPAEALILSTHYNSPMVAKYTSGRVVAAHYSVTPHFTDNMHRLEKIFSWYTPDTTQYRMMKELNVDYVFAGKIELSVSGLQKHNYPFLEKIYEHGSGTVYKFHPERSPL